MSLIHGIKWRVNKKITPVVSKINYLSVKNKKIEKVKRKYIDDIVVSLTSYPARFKTLDMCLKSLLVQTIKPYKIVVYLGNDSSYEDIPDNILAYEKYGIEFRIDKSEDLKPHKKYYYAMQEFKDKNIVTVDDDVVYPPKMLERLYEAHLNNSHVICAGRVHRITFDENGRINEYDKWMHGDDLIKTPSAQLVPIGIGGVLYPPKTMNEKMFDIKSIKELCLKADDLWLKCSSCSVGTKVFAVCNASKYLYELEEAQSTALKKGNVNLKQNDLYFKKAFDFFKLEEKDFRE